MGAAGGVNVMIAAVKAVINGIDPAFEGDFHDCWPFIGNGDPALPKQVFRAAPVNHGQLAGGEQHGGAAVAVDLVLEEKVGGQALGLGRINPRQLVLEGKTAGGRLAVLVRYEQLDRNRGADVEQDRHLRAEAQVLGALANVELQNRLAFAGLAGVDQCEGIFNLETAQLIGERVGGIHVYIQEAILDIDVGNLT